MRHALYLAWRHLGYHRFRSGLVVVSVALALFLPIALRVLVDTGGRAMMARAQATPLVVGQRGSELDLVVASLYFAPPAPRPMPLGDGERLDAAGLVIPQHLGQSARKRPVVGTSIEYFDFRGLVLAEGRRFALLGECVPGASAARRLGLHLDGAGKDNDPPLITDATDPYNLAGTIPLRLRVVGILAPTGTADDEAIFVDIKTAWTIAGLGHGHQEAAAIRDPNDLIGTVGQHVVASERLKHHGNITVENADRFHFHGDPRTFPVHAFLVRPTDERAGTLLRGEFQRNDERLQVVKPSEAMERLLREILRVRRFLEIVLLVVGGATFAIVALVITLTVRLRHDELATMVRLGAARGTVATVVLAEVVLLGAIAAALAGAGIAITAAALPSIERLLVERA